MDEWDVSRVTNMRSTFSQATFFNADLSKWNVSRVTDMSQMFFSTYVFNADLSKWDVSRVTDMKEMFCHSGINEDLSSWNVYRVTSMRKMFFAAGNFTQTLCGDAWLDSNADKYEMFAHSPGTASRQNCSTWCAAGISFAASSVDDFFVMITPPQTCTRHLTNKHKYSFN